MADHDPHLPAGEFSAWLGQATRAVRDGAESDVPCDECTACCRSAQFVHIAGDETDTLAHIPPELLFEAPGAPHGHVVLGFDEHGRCPLLTDDGCSIYDHRPRTCRSYDCRIFPATGLDPGDDATKEPIAERARRWRFAHPGPDDEARQRAVRSAAAHLHEHGAALPTSVRPRTTTQLAVAAIVVSDLYVDVDPASGRLATLDPDPETVGVELVRRRGSS